eukprot:CAMPEP_0115163476 /NCGR_PEP_ID=MMETSP0227-20121206/72536_1 /TAXON_ID=89957 /ORGANISM="Polarella glacialis, Strain CCMP 1383" /LENGTH=154 /DNA_ID=CAMNT_0002575797 /DNA_START=447 /DNA_END=912 /DNA_ORIENTATION=+
MTQCGRMQRWQPEHVGRAFGRGNSYKLPVIRHCNVADDCWRIASRERVEVLEDDAAQLQSALGRVVHHQRMLGTQQGTVHQNPVPQSSAGDKLQAEGSQAMASNGSVWSSNCAITERDATSRTATMPPRNAPDDGAWSATPCGIRTLSSVRCPT